MTVGELLQRMGAQEREKWRIIYTQIDPFGQIREDLRAGMIAAPLINLWSKKGSKRAKPSDFVMRFTMKEPQSQDEMKRVLRAFEAAVKARSKAKAKPRKPKRKPAGSKGEK